MNYKVTITTMTPLHIGTGQDLLAGYDLVVDRPQNRTYRLKVDAILESALTGDNPLLDLRFMSLKPGELVKLEELRQRPEFQAYTLVGTPRSGQVKEQIKNVWGQLYLPGSSLKGALRTAIARSIGSSETMKSRLKITPKKDKADKKSADDLAEGIIFGPDANHDLLRALQVADSLPVETAPLLINVGVIKKGQAQAPIDVEAIPQGVTFETTVRLEEYLYAEQRQVARLENGRWGRPAEKLGWEQERTKWLRSLAAAARNFAQKRLRQEISYFQAADLQRLVQIYKLWQTSLASLKGTQVFYLQLGWGGGWDNKSYGRELIAQNDQGEFDEATFVKLRQSFELGKPPQADKEWQARRGDIFPASRRLRVNTRDEPLEPLGWVEVKLEQVQGAVLG